VQSCCGLSLYTLGMTRVELAGVSIGITLLALGVVASVAAMLRLRRGSTPLLTFGLWCALYGARLLALQMPVRAAIGGTPQQWAQFVALVTYTINVPITIFVVSLIGSAWRHVGRWLLAGVTTSAVVAIAMDLISGTAGAANRINTWVVLASISIGLVAIVHSYGARGVRTPLTEPIVMFGGFILVLFVVNQNLGQIVGSPVNIEGIGVLVFILCLGFALGRSVFRAEAEFVSVQHELETARQIQSSLLPRRVPAPPGLDVAVRYVPMAAVAGDIYDFVEIRPSALGILVADVMGHGIPAAMVASMVKLAFTAQTEHARDPARVLTSMNQVLCRHLEGSYVTAVYAVVDTETRCMTFANAGHPPPLIHRRGEAISQAEPEHGLMLGFEPDAPYTNGCVAHIGVGDRILFYSDGVLEARNRAGEFFDGERVARWLSTIESTTTDRFAEAALRELSRWSDRGQFDDDVTFVVVEATA
jgi:phosphoserine phosphatase RsbU/P